MTRSALFPAILAGAVAYACGPAAAAQALSTGNVHAPASDVLASGRIEAADVSRLAADGYRHVIDLTLDAETPGFDEAAAVRAAGMAYDRLPIRGAADLTPDNARAFDRLLRESARPLLVHCASGNRVGALAALRAAWVDGRPLDEALEEGRRWGLAGLEPAVRERLEAGPDAR